MEPERSGGRAARSRGGVVTFLFTDLVDSTRASMRLGEDAAEELRRAHFALLRAAIDAHAGEEVKNLGDGLMVVFTSPVDAVEAAAAIQTSIAEHNGARPDRPLSVRIGLHAGEPVREDGDYFGTPVVIAARLCAAAQGGAILAGDLVAALVGSRSRFTFRPVGPMQLKGLTEPVSAVAIEGVAAEDSAPLRTQRTDGPRPRRSAPRGPELVGRGEEIAALDEEYASAVAGQFRCVLLSGDPGVGKTRLAVELLARHGEQATVLRSRAHPMAAGAAFGVWAEALDPLLQVLGDDEVAELCGGFLDDLAGLFHRVAALRGPWSTTPAGHEPPRPRLLAGLIRILDELTARSPVLVLLDDMHWADASSWELLRQVARRLDGAPMLVVVTARQVELAEHETAAQVLFELEQDGLLSRFDVGPLARAGLRDLAEQVTATAPPAALVEWLSERSLGNPLFAVGLLRALMEEGADLSAPALNRLPESLTERVAARARSASPAQLAILELLVVAGRPVALGDLIALAGKDLEELSALLAELVATRGVVETERGHSLTYEIAHPLVREALYEQIGGARRRVLHRQAGRVFREAGHVAEAALHFAHSAEPGDPEAVAALLDALAEAEAREAVGEALTLLASVVELLPAADPRWLDVLGALRDRAEWVTDHRAETSPAVAVAALRAIDGQLTDSVDPARRALVKFRLAHFLAWGTGDLDEAETLCRAAGELFAAAGDGQQARMAERELAWIHGLQGRPEQMMTESTALVVAAREAGDDWAEMLALSAVVPAAMLRGRFDECVAANERAASLAAAANKPYRLTVAANMSAYILAAEGRVTLARAVLAEAKLRDPDYRETGHLDIEALVETVSGNFPAALAAARESAAISPNPRLRRLTGMHYGAVAAVEMGEPEEAARHLDRGQSVLRGRTWQFHGPAFRYAAGLLAWSLGDLDVAAAQVSEANTELTRMGTPSFPGASPAQLDLAELAAEIGDASTSAAAARELADFAAAVDRDPFWAAAALGAAWAALAGGDHVTAQVSAGAALKRLAAVESPILVARAHYVLGRALAVSAPAEAAAAYDEAARLFEQCGAVWRRGLVLAAMRRTGSSGRRVLAAALGPGSLTRREREVARLAAEGRSAKEIAQALFVGERTVETHLGNIYAKLGVDSKLDLVRRAAELGLT